MTVEGTRRCTKCRETKPLSAFYKRSDREGYVAQCRACRLVYITAWQSTPEGRKKTLARKRAYYRKPGNKDKVRDGRYRRHYGSSMEAYAAQLDVQEGRCAICKRLPMEGEKHFSFDHDHTSGETRGILCFSCNCALGCFKDSPELLQAAITYLREWANWERARQEIEELS